MNLKNYVVGGLAALALGGCGHALKELKKDERLAYTVDGNGLLVPKLGGFKTIEFRAVGDNLIGTSFFDRNHDGRIDMAAIEVYKNGEAPIVSLPSERYLLVDTDKWKSSNSVDVVYCDTRDRGLRTKSDGIYDYAIDAYLFYNINSGGKVLSYTDTGIEVFTIKVRDLLEDELRKETK